MTFFFLSTETFAHTVKPFYSGYHSDLKVVSVVERCPLHKVFLKFTKFASKIWFRVLGDNAIDPKVCQESGVGEALRQHITEYHFYMIIWKPLVVKCLQYIKNSTNEVAKNIVRTNSQRKEEIVGHLQQKSP